MVKTVAVIDYGIGNLGSLGNALTSLGYRPDFVRDPEELAGYQRAILPGVGNFGACASRLREAGFEIVIRDRVLAGEPLLGICVGMQLFFMGSDESDLPGLGLLEGRVERMASPPRLPEMQWNLLEFADPLHPVFAHVTAQPWCYFVHSYAVRTSGDAIAWEDYGGRYVAAIAKGMLIGFQFHPEKSGRRGLEILGGALELAGGR